MSARLLIDVSQFASHPVPTGIQRTLFFLARHWPSGRLSADTGFRLPGSDLYTIAPMEAFESAIEQVFQVQQQGTLGALEVSRQVCGHLADNATASIAPRDIPDEYEGYLLPEPTFYDHVLDAMEFCAAQMGSRCLAIVYDAIPQTHPHFYPGPHTGATDRYYISLGKLESLGFISAASLRIFEDRFRRSPVPNPVVIPLGADTLGRETNPVPVAPGFVVPGTVEPRKKHQMILGAFEQLWNENHDISLNFLGVSGWDSPRSIEGFRQYAKKQELFTWNDMVTDTAMRDAMRSASGVIYVSELEGYGLPPLEALALGCPVIVSDGLPSLEGLDQDGQLRLPEVSEESIASAVLQHAEPETNGGFRRAIGNLDLPGWESAVSTLAAWAENALGGSTTENKEKSND